MEFIAPDLPGHGTLHATPFTLANALKVVDEAVESAAATTRPVVLVGDSLGGYLALVAASRLGNRIHAVVAAGASFDMRGFGGSLVAISDLPIGLLQFALGRERCARMFARVVRRMTDPQTAEAIMAGGIRLDSRHESILELQRIDLATVIKGCSGRVYMVNGALDVPAVWYTRKYAGYAKNGYAVTIPLAWHGCALTHPAEFADVVSTAVAAAQVDIAHRMSR